MKVDRPLIVYDLVGGAVVTALLGIGVWTAVCAPISGGPRLRSARTQLDRLLADARAMSAAVNAKQSEERELQARIEAQGALPTRAPIDAGLREVTRLAKINGVTVADVRPDGKRDYTGVTEQRFAVNTSGPFSNVLGFLRAFEKAPFWADVTQVTITSDHKDARQPSSETRVALVVSLFSAAAEKDAATP